MFKFWYSLLFLLLPLNESLLESEPFKPRFYASWSELLEGVEKLQNFPLYSKYPGSGNELFINWEIRGFVSEAVSQAGP